MLVLNYMSKIAQKGYVNIPLIFLLIIGIIVGVYLVKNPTNILPKAYQEKIPFESVDMSKYASMYINSARKNIRVLPDGRQAIVPSKAYEGIPSKAYEGGMYIRDAFYAMIGLGDISLSEDSFRLFEQTQDESGQVRFAVPLPPNERDFGFKDDESNLIYLIWAGVLNRQGISLEYGEIEKAYLFVTTHVQNGWFVSSPGDYRYWADTYDNKQFDTLTYNQGLYTLSLRFLKELKPDLVLDEIIALAEENFRSLFKDAGSLPLSKNTQYQDASSLLPEFLARLYFNRGMLEDNQIIASVDKLIEFASVYNEIGSLQGIKIIYDVDGSFLPYEVFKPPMNNKGVYQNGGYWPMYVLVDLSLAYKVSGNDKYKRVSEKLIEKELGSDGKSKEFIYLEERRIGTSDPERSDYSWNALITTALKWSGMTQ